MKIIGWLVFLGSFAALACSGQTPPANDNFSNRIVLSGTDLTFTGALAGATLENHQEDYTYDAFSGGPLATQSVWWSWTAPVSTMLTLQILDSSLKSTQIPRVDGLVVYAATNSNPSIGDVAFPWSALGAKFSDFRFVPLTLSIPVSAGTEYEIQLIGSSSATYTIQLTATNLPIIVQQPRSRTVYSNASALFYVIAAGDPPPPFTGYNPPMLFSYQWRSNGVGLPGEIGPVLALSNIDSTMAAAYSVVVSNANGFTVSQSATLTVSQSNVPISLSVIGLQSNSLTFSLAGENGRSYRIESSADLVNWASEPAFPLEPLSPNSTSVVFNTNSPLILTVSNNLSRKFFRATPYVLSPPNVELCVNHLEQIRIARLLWQRDYDIWPHGTPVDSDLVPYYPRQLAPACPLDFNQLFQTSYNEGEMLEEPSCIISPFSHFLEEAR